MPGSVTNQQVALSTLATLPKCPTAHANLTALRLGLIHTTCRIIPLSRHAHLLTGPIEKSIDRAGVNWSGLGLSKLYLDAASVLTPLLLKKGCTFESRGQLRYLLGSLLTYVLVQRHTPEIAGRHTLVTGNNLALSLAMCDFSRQSTSTLNLVDCSQITAQQETRDLPGINALWPSHIWLTTPDQGKAHRLKTAIPSSRIIVVTNPGDLLRPRKSATTDWLTIVIPCIDTEQLHHAIDSIRRQSLADTTKVIVIDGRPDISPDDILTFELAEPSRVLDLKVFRVFDDSPYSAMNLGLSQAATEWIYFMGVDDTLADPFVLEDVKEKIDAIPSSCQMLYGDVRMVGAGPGTYHGEVYAGAFDYKRLKKQNICHQSIFYRAEHLVALGGFNPEYRVNADWAMNICNWQRANPQYYGRIIANFQRGGLSSRVFDQDFFDVLDKLWDSNQ